MTELIAHLLARYALFLETMRGRYDLADRYYQRAISAAPDSVPNHGRYAVFLETVAHDFDAAEEQYRQALELAPNEPVILGNYADFLDQVRGDYDAAEQYYRRALESAPLHPNNLTNYATFLTEVRGEYERAEDLYRLALDAAPNHRNGLFKYAIFLTDIRHDYEGAESLYRRGLRVAPDNPAMMANFAGLLLLRGKREEGLAALGEALRHPALQKPSADSAECWFYALLHGAPEGQVESLRALHRLLEAGVRSPGFRLEPHVAIARAQDHPSAEWLVPLARVITDEAPLAVLDGWVEWRRASPGVIH